MMIDKIIFAMSLATNMIKVILFQPTRQQLKRPFIYNLSCITFLKSYVICLNKKKVYMKIELQEFLCNWIRGNWKNYPSILIIKDIFKELCDLIK